MGRSERDTFLSKTRLGILTTLNAGGEPISVPVWFEWDGRQARCFSYNRAAKVRRLKRDQRAWLLVTNAVGEPEFWVAIDGTITIRPEGALELALRLAERYWDLGDPARAADVRRWQADPDALVRLELVPTRIRAYSG